MMCTSFKFVFGAAVASVLAFTAPIAVAEESASLEFPAETEAVVLATADLFNRVEARGVAPVKKRPVIRMPRLATKASVVSEASSDPLLRNGPLQHLTGYQINWYPTDRFLGSVDFMGTWDGNRNLVCGYLMWDVTDATSPVLDSVSVNYVDLAELDGASPAHIHETLLEANCAFGAIEANFAFFEPLG